jgi:gas vesicle protein
MSESFNDALGGGATGAVAGAATTGTPYGALIGGGIGAVTGLFSGHSSRKRDRERKRGINQAYDEGEGLVRGGFSSARQMYGDTANRARGIYNEGFDRTKDIVSSGYNRGRDELNRSQGESEDAYDTDEMTAVRGNLYRKAMGGGGLSADAIESQKNEVGDVYANAQRDIVQQGQGFAGDSQAGGLQYEQMAQGFGNLAQRKASDIRDINTGQAQMVREDERYGGEQLTDHANTISGMKERFGTAASQMTVDQALAEGQLSDDEMDTLAELESSLGETLAGLTLAEAMQLAEMKLGRSAAINGQQRPASNPLAALAPIIGAYAQGGFGGGQQSPTQFTPEPRLNNSPLLYGGR